MAPFQEIQYLRWQTLAIYITPLLITITLYLFGHNQGYIGIGIIIYCFFAFILNSKMSVVVSDNTIYIKQYFQTRTILLKNIKAIASYDNYKEPWFNRKKTWCLNYTNSVIELFLKSGESVIIGTQDRQKLETAIRAHLNSVV